MAYKPAFMNVPPSPRAQSFTFPNGNNGGMNIRLQSDQIRDDQSPDMLNMCYRDGCLSNRLAFDSLVFWGVKKICGMHEYIKTDGTSMFLIAWEGKIYSFNTTTYAKTDLCTGVKSSLEEVDTYFFSMNDTCYIYNGTDFCYYDGVNPVADVVGYVPTISTERTPAGVGTVNEDLNFLSNSWNDSFNGTVGDTAYKLSMAADSVVVTVNGSVVADTEYTFPTGGADYETVTFDSAPGAGVNNVVITATKADLNDPTVITKCTQFMIYGGRNDNRVFACRLNVRYHSGLNDPTYWPVSNYNIITSDTEDITGFGRMLDYLVVLKERSLRLDTIEADSSGNIIWPDYPLNDEYGCMAKDSIKSVNNGILFLARTNEGSPAGVAYLSPSNVRDQLNVQIISRDINVSVDSSITGLLDNTEANLINAKSIVYDDKYWIKVNNRCWILDLAYSDFAQGIYCWYPYSGIPARANCFLDYGGDLYIGLTMGMIGKEGSGVDESDDEGLDFYWTSPIVYCGTRTWMKDFEELFITFGRQVIATNKITFITDDGKEEVVVSVQAANLFDFGNIDFSAWSFGANPYPSTQPEIVGYSAEYLQWKIQNDELGQGLVILSQELTYKIGERVY